MSIDVVELSLFPVGAYQVAHRCPSCETLFESGDELHQHLLERRLARRAAEAAALAAREAAIAASTVRVPADVQDAMLEAVTVCARTLRSFTADDVWDLMADRGMPMPGQPSALGPVFLRAARTGLIVRTGAYRQTRIARRHRTLVVWCDPAHLPQEAVA